MSEQDQRIRHVAVTGATGFVGTNLVRALLDRGWAVNGLARSAEKESTLPPAVKAIIGDINDRPALDRLAEGCDTFVHLVSNFRVASGSPESYTRINFEGTRTALAAARAAGVKRFVYCSTIGVFGNVKSTPADETSAYAPGDLYQETKLESEEFLRAEMGKDAMEIVIVRPCSIYGPGDLRMLKMFRMLAKRRFMLAGPCRENFHAVYIDDLIKGFIAAIETPGISGESFIVGGAEYLPLDDYIATAAAAVGAPPPWLRVPYAPLMAAAVVCEALCVPFGIEPPLHRRRVRFFKNNRAFNIAKAKRVLGYEPEVSLKEGFRRTVAWYREQGLLS